MDAKSWSMTLSKNQRLRTLHFFIMFHPLMEIRERFSIETGYRIHHLLAWACPMCHWSRFLPIATSFVYSLPKIQRLWSALVDLKSEWNSRYPWYVNLQFRKEANWANVGHITPNAWIVHWVSTSDKRVWIKLKEPTWICLRLFIFTSSGM